MPPGESRATYTVAEAARVAGIGRNSMYALVHLGQVPHRMVGRRILIPRERFHEWLNAT